jgi:hypothetical protein
MKSWDRMLVVCFLCISLLCLAASATVTVTSVKPTVSIDPENTVIAVGATVTIYYVDDVGLSSADTASIGAVTWKCYVNNDLNSDFPKTIAAITYNSRSTLIPAGNGSFSFTTTADQVGSNSVYCTASGDLTPTGGTATSISGTSNTVNFSVSDCTGDLEIADDEQPSSDAAYTEMDFDLMPTMNPPYSGGQNKTVGEWQGISGDLTAAGLDIDCEDDNNDDPPEQNADVTGITQTAGSNSVTFNLTITQYGYAWDDCDDDTCPPPPPGAVEDVQVCTADDGADNCTAQPIDTEHYTFSCGEQ